MYVSDRRRKMTMMFQFNVQLVFFWNKKGRRLTKTALPLVCLRAFSFVLFSYQFTEERLVIYSY